MGVWEKKADCLGNPIPRDRIAHFSNEVSL